MKGCFPMLTDFKATRETWFWKRSSSLVLEKHLYLHRIQIKFPSIIVFILKTDLEGPTADRGLVGKKSNSILLITRVDYIWSYSNEYDVLIPVFDQNEIDDVTD